MVDRLAAEPAGRRGNSLRGRAVAINSSNVLVRSEEQLAAVVGLDNVVVVATGDAVLVADQSQTDKVKQLVERLKAERRPEATQHRRMYRPWGYYQSIDQGRALSGQAHRGAARRPAVAAKAPSPRGTLGRGARGGGSDAQRRVQLVHENESVYLPIGSNTGSPIPARSTSS